MRTAHHIPTLHPLHGYYDLPVAVRNRGACLALKPGSGGAGVDVHNGSLPDLHGLFFVPVSFSAGSDCLQHPFWQKKGEEISARIYVPQGIKISNRNAWNLKPKPLMSNFS